MTNMEDGTALLAKVDALYEDDGRDAKMLDVRNEASQGGAVVYGEVTSMERLFEALDLNAADTFYDLGSGRGQIVLAASMRSNAAPAKSVGIELIKARHDVACHARARMSRDHYSSTCTIELMLGDALAFDLKSMTKCFICNPTFGHELTSRFARALSPELAPRLKRVATLAQFADADLRANGLELRRVHTVTATWCCSSGCPLFLYGRVGDDDAKATAPGESVVDQAAVSQMLAARQRADRLAMEAAAGRLGDAPTAAEAERGSLRTALIAAAMYDL